MKKRKISYWLIGILVAIVLISFASIQVYRKLSEKDVVQQVEIVTSSEEEYSRKICELSSCSYTNNAIAKHINKKNKKVDFYARYTGEIQYGIKDAEKIKIHKNSKDNVFEITLPPIEVLSSEVIVDDLVFVESEADKEGVFVEAYNVCKADLDEVANKPATLDDDWTIIDEAKASVERMIDGLFESWTTGDSSYKVRVKWGDTNE